ncbi:hypothetical protein D1646_03705 [Pseudoflavonifractor sp. 60]|nr:hypothetical protein [Pseudoflavonifractor sp. 60]
MGTISTGREVFSVAYRGKRTAGGGSLLWAVAAVLVTVAVLMTFQTAPPVQTPPPADASGGESSHISPDLSQPQGSDDSAIPSMAPLSEPYDFSQPAPAGEAVDNSYFADAAFVGDSRTDGFMVYSGIGCGKNLTSNGLSIFRLDSKKALTIDGETYTLLEALAQEQYGKVYLSLGVNELGYHNDQGFYNSYCQAIDQIRAIQPQAVIYIQGLIPLNEDQIMASSGRDYLTNEHLRTYNDLMRQAAQEKQVVYLDLYSEFADENGALPEGASRDGVHLGKEYCQQWLEYLKTHTVELDRLYPDGPPAVQTVGPDTSTADGSALE